MAERGTASGALGLVQTFVNSVDLQEGPEELSDPVALGAWLVAKGLMAAGSPVGAADLQHAIGLREAVRNVIGANSGGTIYPVDLATLNQAASASRLRPLDAAQAVRVTDLPVGLFRPVPQSLEPVVRDVFLRQSSEGQALPPTFQSRHPALTGGVLTHLAHRRALTAKAHRGDLGQDAERCLFGSAAAQVEADRAVYP